MITTQKTPSVVALQEMIASLYHGKLVSSKNRASDAVRDVCCTPFQGAYGIAGWIVCVNGSPPHGILVLNGADANHFFATLVMSNGKSKTITGKKQVDVIKAFFKGHLENEVMRIIFKDHVPEEANHEEKP